jgi:hypothetical protein
MIKEIMKLTQVLICNIYFQDVENVNLIKLNYILAQFVKQILIYKVDIKLFN